MQRNWVWILNVGGYAGTHADQGDYDDHIEFIRTALEDLDLAGRPITIEVVRSVDDALVPALSVESEAVLVFMTRGELDRAQVIKRDHPDLRVVLVTAAPDMSDAVQGGVLIVDKMDMVTHATIPPIILGGEVSEVPIDWTVDPALGTSNSSPKFLELVGVVRDTILDSGHDLIHGDAEKVARSIMANLAHGCGLAPQEEDPSE